MSVFGQTNGRAGSNDAASAGINQLFAACDLDGSGFIEREELRAICNELTGEELSDVFRQLDSDGDGKISIDEFAEGFQAMRDTLVSFSKERQTIQTIPAEERARRLSICLDWRRNSKEWSSTDRELLLGVNQQKPERRKSLFDLVGSLDEGFTALSCQEQICELYQQLHDYGYHDQLSKFEDVLVSIIKDVRKQQCENERLERSYQREKEAHSRHLRQLEEEMEAQMQKVEQRVRKEEKEKYDSLKEELISQHETEIDALQMNLTRLQTLDTPVTIEKPPEDLKARLDELLQENRSMKRTLNDAQTSLALQRSEMTTLRVQLEEKCYELETEKQALVEYMKEHDNLTRQIHMLHDANKTLQDTNDDLREALETTRSTYKRPHSLRQRVRRSSFIGQHLSGRNKMLRSLSAGSRGEYVRRYLQESTTTPDSTDQGIGQSTPLQPDTASLAEELAMFDDAGQQPRTLLPAQDSCETDSIPEDDSGRFTMREVHDEYSDDEGMTTPKKRNRASVMRNIYRTSSAVGSQMLSSFETQCSSLPGGPIGSGNAGNRYCGDNDSICPSGPMDDIDTCSIAAPSVSCSVCSHSTGGTAGLNFDPSNALVRRGDTLVANQKPISQDPERIFKIVLAGDAAVGKSSFIMRLCKNKFVANLNSTLGVDFQTKTLEIAGRVIALQLWDTAGQERFRSIAKSYFRRADGVLLLYDVTYERSFLNVRDWMEAIEEGAQKQIPIMLVGNKCDLRSEQPEMAKNCVKLEDGQRLAREYAGLFIESSVKDGKNVVEAVTELSRMLMTNEDLEVQSIGLKLQDVKENGKKRSACCNL